MTNEEMKVLKFKTMMNRIADRLHETSAFYDKEGNYIHPVKVLLDIKEETPFLNCVVNRETKTNCGKYKANIEAVIEASEKCNCSRGCGIERSCSVAGQTIFYALIALAIDNDLYNEKLEIVSDAAYLMGFNTLMMEDWVRAVKRFMMDEKINRGDLKTQEAQVFFRYL